MSTHPLNGYTCLQGKESDELLKALSLHFSLLHLSILGLELKVDNVHSFCGMKSKAKKQYSFGS